MKKKKEIKLPEIIKCPSCLNVSGKLLNQDVEKPFDNQGYWNCSCDCGKLFIAKFK